MANHTPTQYHSPPLTNLAAQTVFSQPQKDCSGSSKDGHDLKLEQLIVEVIEMSVVKEKFLEQVVVSLLRLIFVHPIIFLCAV